MYVCLYVCTPFVCYRNVVNVYVYVSSKNPFHCCLQIIDVDCLNEMFAVHYLLLLLFARQI